MAFLWTTCILCACTMQTPESCSGSQFLIRRKVAWQGMVVFATGGLGQRRWCSRCLRAFGWLLKFLKAWMSPCVDVPASDRFAPLLCECAASLWW